MTDYNEIIDWRDFVPSIDTSSRVRLPDGAVKHSGELSLHDLRTIQVSQEEAWTAIRGDVALTSEAWALVAPYRQSEDEPIRDIVNRMPHAEARAALRLFALADLVGRVSARDDDEDRDAR